MSTGGMNSSTGGDPVVVNSQSVVSGVPNAARHWGDRIMLTGKYRNLNVQVPTSKFWNEVVKTVYDKYCERGVLNRDVDPPYD